MSRADVPSWVKHVLTKRYGYDTAYSMCSENWRHAEKVARRLVSESEGGVFGDIKAFLEAVGKRMP